MTSMGTDVSLVVGETGVTIAGRGFDAGAAPFRDRGTVYIPARAFFEAGEIDRASELLEGALKASPNDPEVHYYQALLCEERGEAAAASAAFLRVRQLELEAGMPSWAPDGETFLSFTARAVASLPPEIQRAVGSAQVYVADVPGPEAVVDGVDPRAPALSQSATPPPVGGLAPARPPGPSPSTGAEPRRLRCWWRGAGTRASLPQADS